MGQVCIVGMWWLATLLSARLRISQQAFTRHVSSLGPPFKTRAWQTASVESDSEHFLFVGHTLSIIVAQKQ